MTFQNCPELEEGPGHSNSPIAVDRLCPQIVMVIGEWACSTMDTSNNWKIDLLVSKAQHTLIGVQYTSPLLLKTWDLSFCKGEIEGLWTEENGHIWGIGAVLKKEEINVYIPSPGTQVHFFILGPRTLAAQSIHYVDKYLEESFQNNLDSIGRKQILNAGFAHGNGSATSPHNKEQIWHIFLMCLALPFRFFMVYS